MKAPSGVPDANEFGQLIAYLKSPPCKFSQSWITDVIGDAVNGRDRSVIVGLLKDALRVLPKAQ